MNQTWLQIGYKKFVDTVEIVDYLDCVHEKRIESAVYYEESKPSTRAWIQSGAWPPEAPPLKSP